MSSIPKEQTYQKPAREGADWGHGLWTGLAGLGMIAGLAAIPYLVSNEEASRAPKQEAKASAPAKAVEVSKYPKKLHWVTGGERREYERELEAYFTGALKRPVKAEFTQMFPTSYPSSPNWKVFSERRIKVTVDGYDFWYNKQLAYVIADEKAYPFGGDLAWPPKNFDELNKAGPVLEAKPRTNAWINGPADKESIVFGLVRVLYNSEHHGDFLNPGKGSIFSKWPAAEREKFNSEYFAPFKEKANSVIEESFRRHAMAEEAVARDSQK
jgi:hypothetical protein